ncbi:hypothetical protein WH91_01425 [Devosia psychrophila]|uniref:Secreted protein n=1 Tax=Devosia psychrophila TaxID=728005 RepID=A0ABR5E3K6_9HYPH|nr:hypothetical protein WH91_01425 [Devosia psychrophila]
MASALSSGSNFGWSLFFSHLRICMAAVPIARLCAAAPHQINDTQVQRRRWPRSPQGQTLRLLTPGPCPSPRAGPFHFRRTIARQFLPPGTSPPNQPIDFASFSRGTMLAYSLTPDRRSVRWLPLAPPIRPAHITRPPQP